MKTPHKIAAGAVGAIALAAVLIPQFEGERHKVYRDVIGIPTYCDGETRNPDWQKIYTHEECDDLLKGRLAEFNAAIDGCVHAPLTTGQRAASISFTYNLGAGAFCHSSIARAFNDGRSSDACDNFMKFDMAGASGQKHVVPGLARRREAERKICLED